MVLFLTLPTDVGCLAVCGVVFFLGQTNTSEGKAFGSHLQHKCRKPCVPYFVWDGGWGRIDGGLIEGSKTSKVTCASVRALV